jgi:hypothetical protein
MKIFNEYVVLTHRPTKDLVHKIYLEIYDHIKQLLDDGVPIVEVLALEHTFNNVVGAAFSEHVLKQQAKMSKARRSNDNYQI